MSAHWYLGNPAKRVRELTTVEIERLLYGARHSVKIKDAQRADRKNSGVLGQGVQDGLRVGADSAP
jgi:hypothetical protein